jgi:hypothetical protein
VGLLSGGDVEIEVDGAGIRIEPVAGADLAEVDGFLVIPATGEPIDDDAIRDLRFADQR